MAKQGSWSQLSYNLLARPTTESLSVQVTYDAAEVQEAERTGESIRISNTMHLTPANKNYIPGTDKGNDTPKMSLTTKATILPKGNHHPLDVPGWSCDLGRCPFGCSLVSLFDQTRGE